jgi:hypothetical protein
MHQARNLGNEHPLAECDEGGQQANRERDQVTRFSALIAEVDICG